LRGVLARHWPLFASVPSPSASLFSANLCRLIVALLAALCAKVMGWRDWHLGRALATVFFDRSRNHCHRLQFRFFIIRLSRGRMMKKWVLLGWFTRSVARRFALLRAIIFRPQGLGQHRADILDTFGVASMRRYARN
jgi:CHASE1-domain containing sensor protein